MPQFDPSVWAPQLIWLVITFVALYFLMSRVALPRITDILEEREYKINDAIRKATGLKRDAEDAAASYQKLMADARAKAQAEVRAVRERADGEAADRHAELNAKLSEEVSRAEAGIADARNAAFDSVREMATEAAATATERLIGEKVDAKSVDAAIEAAIKGAS